MEIPTVRVCWCIPQAKGTVPIPLALLTVHNTNANTDSSGPSMYSRGEGNCSPPLALVTIHNTDGNTNDSCPSVYYREEGNCSSPPYTVHYAKHWWTENHRCIPKTKGIVPLLISVMAIKVHLVSFKFPRELPIDCEFQCTDN
jgi:hypothetical protein